MHREFASTKPLQIRTRTRENEHEFERELGKEKKKRKGLRIRRPTNTNTDTNTCSNRRKQTSGSANAKTTRNRNTKKKTNTNTIKDTKTNADSHSVSPDVKKLTLPSQTRFGRNADTCVSGHVVHLRENRVKTWASSCFCVRVCVWCMCVDTGFARHLEPFQEAVMHLVQGCWRCQR